MASVALLENDQLAVETELAPQKRVAQILAPALSDLLKTAGWKPGDVDVVAVSRGPGSFTGLRVGVTTAKMFAYAVGASIIGVSTLDVIAAQSQAPTDRLWAVLDAQRSQLFASFYERGADGEWAVVQHARIVNEDEWLRDSSNAGVTGPGLERLREKLPASAWVEDPSRWTPKAATVGRLAVRRHLRGEKDDVWSLVPFYCRKSAAEEKCEAKDQNTAERQ
jgi:tRNA threonylcarbamoyladenosine biosynthesis protein TsaB